MLLKPLHELALEITRQLQNVRQYCQILATLKRKYTQLKKSRHKIRDNKEATIKALNFLVIYPKLFDFFDLYLMEIHINSVK